MNLHLMNQIISFDLRKERYKWQFQLERLVKLVRTLLEEFEDSNIFIASDLTKIHERGFFGKTKDVLERIKDDENIEKGEYVIVFEKNKKNEINEEDYSLEAKLVDVMVKENLTMKDAISKLSQDKNVKKNDLYKASLNLKDKFKEQ